MIKFLVVLSLIVLTVLAQDYPPPEECSSMEGDACVTNCGCLWCETTQKCIAEASQIGEGCASGWISGSDSSACGLYVICLLMLVALVCLFGCCFGIYYFFCRRDHGYAMI
jgi:hypothetical protein